MSEAVLKAWTPELRAAHSIKMKEVFKDPAVRARLSAARRGKGMVPKNLTPEERQRRREHMQNLNRNRVMKLCGTAIEVELAALLEAFEIPYRHSVQLGRYTVDFYSDELNTVYEADGEYWHDQYEKRSPGYHASRDKYLIEEYGVEEVLHFTGTQLYESRRLSHGPDPVLSGEPRPPMEISPEGRKRISDAKKLYWKNLTPEGRKIQSEAMKSYWKNLSPDDKERRLEAMKRGRAYMKKKTAA